MLNSRKSSHPRLGEAVVGLWAAAGECLSRAKAHKSSISCRCGSPSPDSRRPPALTLISRTSHLADWSQPLVRHIAVSTLIFRSSVEDPSCLLLKVDVARAHGSHRVLRLSPCPERNFLQPHRSQRSRRAMSLLVSENCCASSSLTQGKSAGISKNPCQKPPKIVWLCLSRLQK